jgi:hypothetical protein
MKNLVLLQHFYVDLGEKGYNSNLLAQVSNKKEYYLNNNNIFCCINLLEGKVFNF